MATLLLVFLTLHTEPYPSASCPPAFQQDSGTLMPLPFERSEHVGFLPDDAATEESEEEGFDGDLPRLCVLLPITDQKPLLFTFDPSLSPHPLHSRDRRGSPRSPPHPKDTP